jgi:hypothetical protein
MHEHLSGPFWGNLIIIVLAGTITAACLFAMFRMLFHPGETDWRHPKYDILHDDC